MKKLKEIPFNHELIGKEGIEVKYRNGKEVGDIYLSATRMFQKKEYPILSVDKSGDCSWHALNGNYHPQDCNHPINLIMYKEIEVKEPRVIWVNIYESGAYGAHPTAERAANCAVKGEKHETVKFIEVIEEGE